MAAAAAQLQPPTIITICDEIISTHYHEQVVQDSLTNIMRYAGHDMDYGFYTGTFSEHSHLVTYNPRGEPEFFLVNNEPYILRLIYDMVDNNLSMLYMPQLHDNAYAFLEKYKLKDAYDDYKIIFDKKTADIKKQRDKSANNEIAMLIEGPTAKAYSSSANGGRRRSKRSHRKTRKGKSRKHRSKGGRRGKSRKH